MVFDFPKSLQKPQQNGIKVRLQMSFDLPAEMAEQLEMWGIDQFDSCEFDQDRCCINLSASTTLYRKGA